MSNPLPNLINPKRFGASFSVKECRGLGVNAKQTLRWLIDEAGFRRFRLMSYWNEHEPVQGTYDFAMLDWQIARVAEVGGEITLCLGARQPRWPENHWPDWAWQASKAVRTEALLTYIETVINRYKLNPAIISYQLENEALLKNFGRNSEVDRPRLRAEFAVVKRLDPTRPVIMTTSTSWGIPIRQPIPDIVGFSYYHTLYRQGNYHYSLYYPWAHRLRKFLIWQLLGRRVFIHEQQCEPWGPRGIKDMDEAEQDKSMSAAFIERNLRLAKRVKAYPIDLWGAEWWYWRHKQGDDSIWHSVSVATTED